MIDTLDGYCLCFRIADDNSDRRDSFHERIEELQLKLKQLSCDYTQSLNSSIFVNTVHKRSASSKMTSEYAVQIIDALYKDNLLKAEEVRLAKASIENVKSNKTQLNGGLRPPPRLNISRIQSLLEVGLGGGA